MTGTLDQQVAIVTGAGRGIGRAIALGLAAEGASVAVLARSADEISRTAREISAGGGSSVAITADVRDPAQVTSAVEQAQNALGPPTLLVKNAGAPGPCRQRLGGRRRRVVGLH